MHHVFIFFQYSDVGRRFVGVDNICVDRRCVGVDSNICVDRRCVGVDSNICVDRRCVGVDSNICVDRRWVGVDRSFVGVCGGPNIKPSDLLLACVLSCKH